MGEYLGKDIRKIIRVGGSVAITLPKEYLDAHGLKLGDKMELNFNEVLHVEPVNEAEIRKKLGRPEIEKKVNTKGAKKDAQTI